MAPCFHHGIRRTPRWNTGAHGSPLGAFMASANPAISIFKTLSNLPHLDTRPRPA